MIKAVIFGKYKTVRLAFIGFVLVIIPTTWFIRSTYIEDYCNQKAKELVGDNWETFLEPNPDELGYLLPAGGKGQKITLGFREQIKCERSQKFFFFF